MLVGCTALAWTLMDMNIVLVVWIGAGGLMAAFAGPLVLGALWRGVTRAGAFAGLGLGFGTFLVLHGQLLEPAWFGGASPIVAWLRSEGPNPYSCAAMGELVSVAATWAVSRATRPLEARHVERMFGAPPSQGLPDPSIDPAR